MAFKKFFTLAIYSYSSVSTEHQIPTAGVPHELGKNSAHPCYLKPETQAVCRDSNCLVTVS